MKRMTRCCKKWGQWCLSFNQRMKCPQTLICVVIFFVMSMGMHNVYAAQYYDNDSYMPSSNPNPAQPSPTVSAPDVQTEELDLEFVVAPLDASLAFYQLETQTIIKPSVFYMDGRGYLTYEVFISNVGVNPFKITRIDVLDGDNLDRTIASYDSQQILEMIKSFQLTNSDARQSLILKPGAREVLFFMTKLAGKRDVPRKLSHRFILRSPEASDLDEETSSDFLMHAAPVDVNPRLPVVIGPPLQGNHWLAANGPSNTSINRRTHITNHGVMFFPARFGVDFMQFGPSGKLYKNSTAKNENYYGYGANVYAVADGKVVAVYDGVPDNAPGAHNYKVTLDKLGGNYVLLDIGNKQYVYYAHLIPKSIKVKRGDVVQKGQVLGQVGNSGNSDAPHLHFQVTDKPSSLSAQGIPYGFDIFYMEAYKVPNPDADDPMVTFTNRKTQRKGESVHENALVDFGNNLQ